MKSQAALKQISTRVNITRRWHYPTNGWLYDAGVMSISAVEYRAIKAGDTFIFDHETYGRLLMTVEAVHDLRKLLPSPSSFTVKLAFQKVMEEQAATHEKGGEAELLPCPFCGGRAQIGESFGKSFVECSSCFVRGKTFDGVAPGDGSDDKSERAWQLSRRNAMDAWNTRQSCSKCEGRDAD